DEILNSEQEYTSATQEITFAPEQHAVWADLYAGIARPHLLEHICQEYHQGAALLNLNPQRIPTVAQLNACIHPRTGWMIERTAVRYTKAEDWYQKFARRTFLITDYLR